MSEENQVIILKAAHLMDLKQINIKNKINNLRKYTIKIKSYTIFWKQIYSS